MKTSKLIALAAGLALVLSAASAEAKQGYEKVKGEVVAVQQQTSNAGADQVVTVRTRNGEQKQFRLGDGSCGDCVRVGDRVQARVSKGSNTRLGQVQSMNVRRNQEMYGYAYQSGDLVRTRQRLQDGSGAGRQAGNGPGNGPGDGICDGSGNGAGTRRGGAGRGQGGGGNGGGGGRG